ncbi:MAG: hypothetical protein BWZ10_01167 [candidate division BRC1 bacterium ADurb.BinA364]|nr:MAG: hypothetical protein BWZ10_01167 [candidate division BRC1 bacterium ADurb.BinA364]
MHWDNPFAPPWLHIVLAYDIYNQAYVAWDGGVPYKLVSPDKTSDTLPLIYTGGYHLWTSNLYEDSSWHVSVPWSGIMYSGEQHPLLDVALANQGPNQVQLTWRPDLYGTWYYQILVYKDGAGFVDVVDGPSKFLGIDPWTFIDYGENPGAYDPTKANFFQGWANFTLPGPGTYTFFMRSVGWLPPYNTSDWATPVVIVP